MRVQFSALARRARGAIVATAALAATVIAVAPIGPADAGGRGGGGRDGCQVPEMCTVRPTVEFFGTYATFEFTTHPSIKQVDVIVREKGTDKGGGTAKGTGAAPMSWDPIMVAGLTPDTAYDWTFIATDTTGASYTTTDTSVTLTRKVVISFDHIFVQDDSDEGAGELSVSMIADTGWSPVWDVGDVESPETIWPGHVVTLIGADDSGDPDERIAAVSVRDDDEEAWDSCDDVKWQGATGTNSCEDFRTNIAPLHMGPLAPGVENFTKTETFSPQSPAWMSNDLLFTVNITWTVSYV